MSFSENNDLKGTRFSAFEATLLSAAKSDVVPNDVEAAWARFSGKLTAVASGMEPTSGVHPARSFSELATELSTEPISAAQGTALSAAKLQLLKWTAAGVLGGSALTAMLFLGHAPGPALPVAPVESASTAVDQFAEIAQSPQAGAKEPVSDGKPGEELERTRQRLPVSGVSPGSVTASHPEATVLQAPGHAPAKRAVQPRVAIHDEPNPGSPEPGASQLAKEIARLDAARAAYRAGSYTRALRLIEQYQLEFPHGALAKDAEVVAIEALGKSDDRTTAAQRAARFLRRYPGDPHAARVRRWAE